MRLTRGSRVGVYEVSTLVAIGGMGEVYRARDTRLGRDVALKILTEIAIGDPDREARFEREARAVAALSHPNIIAIHGVGIENGIAFAVMEWLEGRTLRNELASGPLPVRRVLDLGAQIALGLAAAHDKGIIHRDVKPENIFITAEGLVKLLDFGLAGTASGPCPSSPPATDSQLMTERGMVLGTVGYASPEQLSGSAADHRSDMFAFGVVLFEMLTGQFAFRRDSPAETLRATVSEGPPAIGTLISGVPVPLERIVQRCLEKSPAERFQSARDLWFALAQLTALASVSPESETERPQHAVMNRWWFAGAVILLLGLWLNIVLLPHYWSGAAARPEAPVTFTVAPPPDAVLADVPSRMLAISPDGDRLVFAVTKGGHRELWIRNLASAKAEPLPRTEGATEPFWSPDGQQVGFFADSKLKRVSVDGATSMTLCDAPLEARGATWNRDGQIVFADAHGGLSRVAATGGVPTRVMISDREPKHQILSWPQFLPDGRRFLYLRHDRAGLEMGATAYLGTLAGSSNRELVSNVFNALFLAPDRLLFTDLTGIKLQRVDLERGQMSGTVEEFSAEIDRHLGHAALSVSRNGTLAYAAARERDHRLVWVDRNGHETGMVATDDGWRDVVLSPDGSRVAVQRIVPEANDIWTIDLIRGVPSRFTFSPDVDDDPVWSPDGKSIAFSSVSSGIPGIYQKQVDGANDAELLFTNDLYIHPTGWSPDDQFLLFEQTDATTASDLWMLPLQGERRPHPYLATPYSESDAHFSPDGKWVAYTSDESGRPEVYVQRFPVPANKVQISTRGGGSPRWSPNGHELYFLSISGQLMVVPIGLGDRFQAGVATRLFDTALGLGANRYVPSADGKRFLFSVAVDESSAAQIVVVLNWVRQMTGIEGPR